MNPLDALNEEQRAAASQTEGAVLIFAGAGSGKTRVLTHRIAHLLATDLAPAHRILAVTFTNKAAGELRTRLHGLVGEPARGLWVGTFHSIGVRILRRDGDVVGVAPNFVIYDDADQRTLVKRCCATSTSTSGTTSPAPCCGTSGAPKNGCSNPPPSQIPPTASSRPSSRRSTPNTSAASTRPTRSTSTT